jgi:hypothetical protein
MVRDHDYELWIAAPISGTSVAAHNSAGVWMMNAFAARLVAAVFSTLGR